MKKQLFLIYAVTIFSVITCLAGAQSAFRAIPEDVQSKYHFDLARLFFSDASAEKREEANYHELLSRLEQLRGKVDSSPNHLLQALQLYEGALVGFLKLDTYWDLLADRNDLDPKREEDSKAMYNYWIFRRAGFPDSRLTWPVRAQPSGRLMEVRSSSDPTAMA